jgi:hypothetical protein
METASIPSPQIDKSNFIAAAKDAKI